MAFLQKKSPNLNVVALRGWCLKFVDDAVGAPHRQPTAQKAFDVENRNGNIVGGEPPIGVWVPIFFSLTRGVYSGLGHVGWAFNHGNGWIEIHDSETRTGARAVYRNIGEVVRWFGNHGPQYLGWSKWVDGVEVVQEFTPPPAQVPVGLDMGGRKLAKGVARVTSPFALPVSSEPTQASPAVAFYQPGQTFNYDSYIVNDGFVWLSYISFSGVRRYIAEGPNDGNKNNVWVSGGV